MAAGAASCAAAITGTPATTAAASSSVLGVTSAGRSCSMCLLKRARVAGPLLVGFPRAGTDVVALLHWQDEHAAVADFARPRRRHDRFDDVLDDGVGDDDLNLDLREQADAVFLSAVHRRVTFLAAVAAHVGDGHPRDAEFLERLAHVVHLMRAHDTLD